MPRGRWSRPKPKTASRGYGSKHQALRRQVADALAAGTVIVCWRCGKPIVHGMPWDLGHDDSDRRQYRGAEHAYCNRSAGAIAGNAKRRATPRYVIRPKGEDLW